MAKEQLGEASRAAAGYPFVRTVGRIELIDKYDELISLLRQRAALHDGHDNRDLREETLRIAQRSLVDLELLCNKWVQADAGGKTY